jgi:hypothetical protein
MAPHVFEGLRNFLRGLRRVGIAAAAAVAAVPADIWRRIKNDEKEDPPPPGTPLDGVPRAEVAVLPEAKRFHFFLSHRKHHSKLGNASESLAVLIKSVLEERGFAGCLDLDDLSVISAESIEEKVQRSVVMLVLLNDETAKSEWCRKEWELAKKHGVPLLSIFNQDEYSLREIRAMIVSLSESSGEARAAKSDGGHGGGYDFLFEHQSINITAAGRRQAFQDIALRVNALTRDVVGRG